MVTGVFCFMSQFPLQPRVLATAPQVHLPAFWDRMPACKFCHTLSKRFLSPCHEPCGVMGAGDCLLVVGRVSIQPLEYLAANKRCSDNSPPPSYVLGIV